MLNQQETGSQRGAQPRVLHIEYERRALNGGGLLGNGALQSASIETSKWTPPYRFAPSKNAPVISVVREEASRLSKLEALKTERFRPEGKAERVARSLAALNQAEPIELSLKEWRLITEDPDLLDI
jgi:hypothetical protein